MTTLLRLLVLGGCLCPTAWCAPGAPGRWELVHYTPPSGGTDSDFDSHTGGTYYAWTNVTAWPNEVSVKVRGKAGPVYAFAAQSAKTGHEFVAWRWVGSPEGGEVSCLARVHLDGGHASVEGRHATLRMAAEAVIDTPLTGQLFVRTDAQLASNGSVLIQFVTVSLPGVGAVPLPLVSDVDGPNPAPLTIPPLRRQAYGGGHRTTMSVQMNTRSEGSCAVSGTWFPFSHAEADGEIPDGGALGVVLFVLCPPAEPPDPPQDR